MLANNKKLLSIESNEDEPYTTIVVRKILLNCICIENFGIYTEDMNVEWLKPKYFESVDFIINYIHFCIKVL